MKALKAIFEFIQVLVFFFAVIMAFIAIGCVMQKPHYYSSGADR